MRMKRLNEVKFRGKFMFPHNIEIQLGVHGVFCVSVSYSKDRIRVRKLYTEDEFLVEYLKTGTLIKNLKTEKKIEFPNKVVLVIVE